MFRYPTGKLSETAEHIPAFLPLNGALFVSPDTVLQQESFFEQGIPQLNLKGVKRSSCSISWVPGVNRHPLAIFVQGVGQGLIHIFIICLLVEV
jgi:hypothetical protein